MLNLFLYLRPIDQVLIVLFILYALYMIGAIYYVQHEIWGANFRQAIESFIVNLNALTGRIEDEHYNSAWQKERKRK